MFELLMDGAEWKRELRHGSESFFQALAEPVAPIISHCQPADLKVIFFGHKDIFIGKLLSLFRYHSELRKEQPSFQLSYV